MADKFNTLQMGTVASSRVFKLVNSNRSEVLKLISLKVGYVYPDSLIELEELPILFDNLEGGSYISIESLKNRLPSYNPTNLILTLAWLVKLGICRYYP